jgi:hypothetical protein
MHHHTVAWLFLIAVAAGVAAIVVAAIIDARRR